jgi:hypothetical protein
MKSCLAVVEVFHVYRQMDGQAEKTDLIVAFRNFANAPKTAFRNIITNTFRNVSI